MNEDVRKRIHEKVETMVERIEFIEEHLSEDLMEDRILRKALYKEFQEATEAMADICAMVRRGLNSSAKDDYSNIDFLIEKGIVEKGLGHKLKEANGLRNRLIHEYDGLHDETACHAIIELIADLRAFAVVVLEWTER